MKKINFRFLGIFIVFVSVFSNQVVFADIILRKDNSNPTVQPMGVTRLNSFSVTSNSVFAVTADLSGSELILDFNSTLGTAFVTVVDQSGNVVYQTVVDSFSTPELVITLDGLSSGNYSVKISYGSTKLIGDFQL